MNMDLNMDLIRARREARLNQSKAARVLGVSLGTIQRWERGTTKRPAWMIRAAAEILRQLAQEGRHG